MATTAQTTGRDETVGARLTRVAVLGTLAEFHREPIPYDLAALVRFVSSLQPDLLCLDMTPEQWQRGDFGGLPPEYREALLPLAARSDIVVVPVAEDNPPEEPTAPGPRGAAIRLLRRWLASLQRTAPGPTALNEGLRHHVADFLYALIGVLAGGETLAAWRAHTGHLVKRVVEVVRRDPGRRILVVLNVRHCHHVRPALTRYQDLRVVRYSEL